MKKLRLRFNLDPGRTARALLLCGLLCLAATGCQERIEISQSDRPSGEPLAPHPMVDRDLGAIREAGIVRLITRYNSSTYFIHRGGQAGFDYEMAWRFARDHDLTLEVVIPEPGEDLVTLLNTGQGDLVGAGLVPDPDIERWAAVTRPTNFVRKILVVPADSRHAADLRSLTGMNITIPAGDPFRKELQNLKKTLNIQFFVTLGRPGDQAEDLLTLVDRNELQAVAVDDNIARSARAYLPNLELGVHLGELRPTVWLVRNNSSELRAALNRFLKKHLEVNDTGRIRRSRMYGTIYDRYFENPQSIQRFQDPAGRPDKSGIISDYDELIRRKSEGMGLDWRMVAALIYQESEFFPQARSSAGARGLMQVLPRFAGDQADSLFLPEPNLRAGLRLMKQIHNNYAYLDSLDRWRFTLAEYHAGHGHLTDARRLAIEMGRNPNAWEGSLKVTLPRLMERKYFSKTRHGFYGGAKTVDYVEEIMNRFRMYTRLVARYPEEGAGWSPAEWPERPDDRTAALPDLGRPPEPK